MLHGTLARKINFSAQATMRRTCVYMHVEYIAAAWCRTAAKCCSRLRVCRRAHVLTRENVPATCVTAHSNTYTISKCNLRAPPFYFPFPNCVRARVRLEFRCMRVFYPIVRPAGPALATEKHHGANVASVVSPAPDPGPRHTSQPRRRVRAMACCCHSGWSRHRVTFTRCVAWHLFVVLSPRTGEVQGLLAGSRPAFACHSQGALLCGPRALNHW